LKYYEEGAQFFITPLAKWKVFFKKLHLKYCGLQLFV